MKKLAGRDFEDLLQVRTQSRPQSQLNIDLVFSQCSIPVFEGLLPPPHNKIVLDLLFTLATWNAYAKLRLHTEQTLDLFDTATSDLGRRLRDFVKGTCSAYETRELPCEEAARG
jgi:hypothetical protein